jgi:hypothetical protein
MKTAVKVIVILLIAAAVLGVLYKCKKALGRRESYDSSAGVNCAGAFPPAPSVVPQSAYAELVTPLILSSANNPDRPPTMNMQTGQYSDKFVCNTPWKLRAFNNDSCAQYGIGEAAQGPEGNKFCVCEAKYKAGPNGGAGGGAVKPSSPNASNIVVGEGAVCTEHSQCCTGNCVAVPGQFSKMCVCPNGSVWNSNNNKCIPEYAVSPGAFSGMYDNSNGDYYPEPPRGAAPSTGKLCGSNAECGLGEACTPSNFCASMIAADNNTYANKFLIGANCKSDVQCANNMDCIGGVCACKKPLMYEFTSATCQCPDGTKELSGGRCMPPDQVPRKLCPSIPPSYSPNAGGCGLGEQFNFSTNQCMCVADLHTGKINHGGMCTSSNQCKWGTCQNVDGYNVCIDHNTSLYKLAMEEYL